MGGKTSEHLHGLRTEPLGSYFAAIATLKLVQEQKDPHATGRWHQDHFVLTSKLKRETLLDFFQHEYQPTPIASPWNGGSGFFEGDRQDAPQALRATQHKRFKPYRATLEAIDRTLKELSLTHKPTPEQKPQLLKALHHNLPPEGKKWMDAVLTLKDDDPIYNPLFLSGGNDGRFEMARQFMQKIQSLLLDPEQPSRQWLEAALYDHPQGHNQEPAGAYHPASSGGLNASSRQAEADPASNPWTYVLSLEGSIRAEAETTPYQPVGQPSLINKETKRPDITLPEATFSLVPRNGYAHYAIPKERTSERPFSARLDHLIEQLQDRATHAVKQAAHLYQATGQREHLLQTLERVGEQRPHDLSPLSPDWIEATNDGSPEYDLALSLAGIKNIRSQLSIAGGKDLTEKLLRLLKHRLATHKLTRRPQRAPLRTAEAHSIGHFLAGTIDERKLERLLHALVLVDLSPRARGPSTFPLLPYPYLLLKPCLRATPDMLKWLCDGQTARAIEAAARQLGITTPRIIDNAPQRRLAASLIFPINDDDHRQCLEAIGAHPCP